MLPVENVNQLLGSKCCLLYYVWDAVFEKGMPMVHRTGAIGACFDPRSKRGARQGPLSNHTIGNNT